MPEKKTVPTPADKPTSKPPRRGETRKGQSARLRRERAAACQEAMRLARLTGADKRLDPARETRGVSSHDAMHALADQRIADDLAYWHDVKQRERAEDERRMREIDHALPLPEQIEQAATAARRSKRVK